MAAHLTLADAKRMWDQLAHAPPVARWRLRIKLCTLHPGSPAHWHCSLCGCAVWADDLDVAHECPPGFTR